MKALLEVVRFDIADVVTTSGGIVCAKPDKVPPLGDKECSGDMG